MALPTGLAAQAGFAEESTHGTYTAPTRFLEFLSESIKMDVARYESKGLAAGRRVLTSDRWQAGNKTVAGDVSHELGDRGFGLLLKHCFGGSAVTQPASGSDPTVYDNTLTVDNLPTGMTVQVGRPDNSGTVRPFSYLGGMVTGFEIAAKVGEIVGITTTWNFQDEDTSQTLGTASYPSGQELLVATGASLSIASSDVPVTDWSLKGTNVLKADRFKLGSALRQQPLEADLRDYTVDLTAFFPDLTAYNRFVNGTEAALVLTAQGSVISNSYYYSLVATLNVRFDGDTPNVSGPDELMQPLKAKVIDAGSGGISVVYRTTDSAA